MREIYLDNAATTPTDPMVVSAMLPFLENEYGNPGSFHMKGKRAKDAVDAARKVVADFIGAREDEIIFTASGTESDNLAIFGAVRANSKNGKHIVATAIEHLAVLESVAALEKYDNCEVTIVPVEKNGIVNAEKIIAAIRPDTIFVSVMLANNEIGTIQPVAEIGREILRMKKNGSAPSVLFHTDACQAAPYLPLSVEKLHVDLLTINAAKIYGPKGVGALYVKRGTKLRPIVFGGSQEKMLRAGTENVAAIVGFARAIEIAVARRDEDTSRLFALSERLADSIVTTIPRTRRNGDAVNRLPGHVNISFMDVEGEALLLYLDAVGIFASTGSACTSASLDPSHVILALGVPYEVAHGSLRFSLGRDTTDEDIDRVLEALPPLVEKLRAISPVHVDVKYFS